MAKLRGVRAGPVSEPVAEPAPVVVPAEPVRVSGRGAGLDIGLEWAPGPPETWVAINGERVYQIWVAGVRVEHVGETPAGRWVYRRS